MKAFLLEDNIRNSPRDPSIVFYNGYYYHTSSYNGEINIKRSQKIEDLFDAPINMVYKPLPPINKEVWAPELHIIDDKCYIYVAMDDGNNYHHRMYVLENDSSNPLDPYIRCTKISDKTDRWAIDGTILRYNNELYFVWSGWETNSNVAQNIYIAHMQNPTTIDSDRILLSIPEYEWEKRDCIGLENKAPFINEGPFAFYTQKYIYIIYSGSGSWGNNYCLGALRFKGGDILAKDNWEKLKEPLFSRTEEVNGPGHASFIQNSPDNKIYMAYHAFKGDCKTGWQDTYATVQEVYIEDDLPILGKPIRVIPR